MLRPIDAEFLAAGFHAKGVKKAVIVIRISVALVHGHVQLVSAFDQFERIDRERDLAFATDLLGREILELRVRAVAVDALGAVKADAEHEVAGRLVRTHAEMNRHALAGLEDVRGLPLGVPQA